MKLFEPNKMPCLNDLAKLLHKTFPLIDFTDATITMNGVVALCNFPNGAWLYVEASTGELTFSDKGPDLK